MINLFSEFSHNRRFGEFFVLKKPFDSLAEGYYTVKAMIKLVVFMLMLLH